MKKLAPGDAQFIYRFIPRATFTRRKAKHGAKLTVDEGNRVTAVAKVWDFAVEIYKDEERARAFMHRPHLLLEGRKPIDVAVATSVGADLVYDLLGQALYGVAAGLQFYESVFERYVKHLTRSPATETKRIK